MSRITTPLVAVAAGLLSGLALAASAAAGPVYEVTGTHGPTAFQPGNGGTYSFLIQNVGDQATDAGYSDSGTPANPDDDTISDPLTVDLQLPAGVTTRTDHWLSPLLPGTSVGFQPIDRWDCSGSPDPITEAGHDSVRCTYSVRDAERSRLFPGRSLRLFVYVTVDPAAAGSLEATATVSGAGTATVTEIESAPVGANPSEFGIAPGTFVADAFDRQANPVRQAGARPFRAVAGFDFNIFDRPIGDLAGNDKPATDPVGTLRDVDVLLPRGFYGNPNAAAQCPRYLVGDYVTGSLNGPEGSTCSTDSQVGTVDVSLRALLGGRGSAPGMVHQAVYNVVPPRGALAAFGFHAGGHPVYVLAELDPRDYSVRTVVKNADETLGVHYQRLTLWGVPADPVHDGNRYGPNARCVSLASGEGCKAWGLGNASSAPRRPFLTLPSECGVPDAAELRVKSWQGDHDPALTSAPIMAAPAQLHGCERLSFTPSVSVRPTTTAPDSPTGLEVDIDLPQDDNPDGLGTPPLKDATVTLPEGMTINPAGADGLTACTDAQLGLGTNDPISCPDASKVGTVEAKSPALDGVAKGAVYVRSQSSDDPASGEMFRLALVVEHEERGLLVKLPGSVKADPQTGRLTTTFEDNPQLPVSSISVRLKSGPRAPLATPAECGTKTASVDLSSWGGQQVDLTDSFTIPCPAGQGFAPQFAAGSTNPTGGSFSPFVAQIDRPEGQQYLSRVDINMPKGLLAKLKGVALCPDSVAGDGSPGVCPAGSQIGTATVGAGSGSPFFLQGPVYLTGPYQGAPYGLSVQVPAKAGPFDLGMVKVRSALHVDPVTAQVTVASDALPQIVKGVPARLRSVDVNVDRRDFTINPTSCAEKQVAATLTSIHGATSRSSQRFQVGDCQALAFKPRLAMRLSGKRQTRTGGHPGLKAVLTQAGGQANVKAAKVTLPSSVALDAVNSYDPKLVCDYDRALKADCPTSSIIGKATAITPVLNKPLSGNVHLVQGIKLGAKGNRIRTLPTLLVKLRGDVAIDLRAQTSTERKTNRLITTFPAVPDAPVTKFTMTINGGNKGILAVTRTAKQKLNLCNNKQTAAVETNAQNGKQANYNTNVKTPCAKKASKRSKHRK